MRRAVSLPCAIALCVSIWLPAALLAQDQRNERSAAPDVVLSLAEKTLDAIRNNNAGFLARLADQAGIYLGFDAPKMSASRFRKELAEKRGVYCVIFDSSCVSGDFQNSQTASSLREILIAQPVITIAAMQDPQGASQVVSVSVKKATDPHADLFTLYFRRNGGRWRLQQIEYL